MWREEHGNVVLRFHIQFQPCSWLCSHKPLLFLSLSVLICKMTRLKWWSWKFLPVFLPFLCSLSFCILFPSMGRVLVAVLGTQEPHRGNNIWLLTALTKEIKFCGKLGLYPRCRAQKTSRVPCQSQSLFLAFSTVTPSGHRRTERTKGAGSNQVGETEGGVHLLCPFHPHPPMSSIFKPCWKNLGWIVFISISLHSMTHLSYLWYGSFSVR